MTETTQKSNTLNNDGRALLFTEARTANSFSDTPVTDEELSQIWELAKWAPTSANTQPLRIVFVRTDEGRDRLVPHLAEGNQAKTRSAPATAILAVDRNFHEHIPALLPFRPQMRDLYEANADLRTRAGESNAWLQAGYFILAIRALGLAAGPMSGFDSAGVDAEFFPDGRFHSILVVNIGRPGEDPWFDRLPRLDPAESISWS